MNSIETLAQADPLDWPAVLPADQVVELVKALGLENLRGVELPKPEGLPRRGWYEARKVTKAGGRRLYWRWATDQTARPDDLCPCGSGRKFQRCCMRVASASLGRLN